MSNPYLGEIRMFAGNFAPKGWALCNGQLVLITQNQALFAILGTTYGGDGMTNFGLPDFRGRVAVSQGQAPGYANYTMGEKAGQESVTLLSNQLPQHTHLINAVNIGGNQALPTGNFPAVESTGTSLNYSSGPSNTTLNPTTVAMAGGSQPVSVLQPLQVVSFIIALEGIFPSRS